MVTASLEQQLAQIISEEALCKSRATCPRLTIRELFFEPNEGTVQRWQARHGFYLDGVDRRAVFVCESPSDRRNRFEHPHFSVNGQPGWICWDLTPQDRRFRDMRIKYGLQNCVVTNAVKCGLQRPSTPAKLTDDEITNCSRFLWREIETIHPEVVICVGDVACRIVQEGIVRELSYQVPVVKVTHYSHRCSTKTLVSLWERQFVEVRRYLDLGLAKGETNQLTIPPREGSSRTIPSGRAPRVTATPRKASSGAWILRPYPHHMNRFNEFLCESMIALGWPGVGDLRRFDRTSLRARLGEVYQESERGRAFGSWVGTLLTFRDRMREGDLVVVAPYTNDSSCVAIARVAGLYDFVAAFDRTDQAYAHRRAVQWIATDIPRRELPKSVSRGLVQGTLHATDGVALREYCAQFGSKG